MTDTIESLKRKLTWTRAAIAVVTPIVGLALAAQSILLLLQGEALAAGVWMVAAMLSALDGRGRE